MAPTENKMLTVVAASAVAGLKAPPLCPGCLSTSASEVVRLSVPLTEKMTTPFEVLSCSSCKFKVRWGGKFSTFLIVLGMTSGFVVAGGIMVAVPHFPDLLSTVLILVLGGIGGYLSATSYSAPFDCWSKEKTEQVTFSFRFNEYRTAFAKLNQL